MRLGSRTVMVLLLLGLGAGAGWAAEEGTVKATSAWVGEGRFIPIGDGRLYFVGVFSGIIFTENDQGAFNAGKILCPGTLEVDINGGRQRGEGRCVISDKDRNLVFARWSCAGTHNVQCAGRFELTGGTGRFKGITGGGEVRVRTGMAEFAASGSGLHETAAGLAEWPALRYRIP